MVSRTYIRRNLKSLNHMYGKADTLAGPSYFAKLAIIELCGWIEISIDEIIEDCLPRLVQQPGFRTSIRGKFSRTSGFSQKKHLRPLLLELIGYQGIEKLEASCDHRTQQALYRNLNELTESRNALAHTYLKGFTISIDSPGVVLQRMEILADGLDHLKGKLKAMAG